MTVVIVIVVVVAASVVVIAPAKTAAALVAGVENVVVISKISIENLQNNFKETSRVRE